MSDCSNCSGSCNACNTPADPWLARLDDRVRVLHNEGKYGCSQTVLSIGMERLGIDNPDLLRAMEAYCGGKCAGVCGALDGAAALMGLYLGKGTDAEPRSSALKGYVAELTEAFKAYWKSTQCFDLIHDDDEQRRTTCPSLMAGAVELAWGILHEHGIDLDSRKADRMKK